MSWDTKQRGADDGYYYRTVRAGQKTTKGYVGRGPLAVMAARLDEAERHERRTAREARLAERLRLAAADAALDRLGAAADLLFRAALLTAGFHQHHGGEWRRRRTRGHGIRAHRHGN